MLDFQQLDFSNSHWLNRFFGHCYVICIRGAKLSDDADRWCTWWFVSDVGMVVDHCDHDYQHGELRLRVNVYVAV